GLDGLMHPYHPGSRWFGRLFTLIDPYGTEYDLWADPREPETFGKFYAVRDRRGNELTYTWGGIKSNRGVEVKFERDFRGWIERIIDPLGNVIRYQYDGYGDLVAVIDQMDFQTQFRYNTARVTGQSGAHPHYLETVIDPLGRIVRSVEYGEDGRLKTLIVNGQPIRVTYDLGQRLQTITDPLGRVTAVVSDERGNVTEFIRYRSNGSTLIDRFTYDDNDNLLSATDPLGNVTTFTYDAQRNRTSVTRPHNPGARPSDFTTEYLYNRFAQVTAVIGPDGGVKIFDYDTRGNLTSETDPMGDQIYSATYDEYSRITSETTANGTSNYQYGTDGQLTQMTDPNGEVTLFSHDANGRITGITMNGITIETLYDERGRVSSETHPELGTITYEYGHFSNWTGFDSPHMGRHERVFDAGGRLTEWRTSDGTLKVNYRPDGTIESRTSPNGMVTEYGYDDIGRQSQ
ncbi:MAG TPA: hypothetical protein VNK04_02575, partial [Gemmataceae bacterium]|nr:hypothetical protein [Gemmataceae bacterium]